VITNHEHIFFYRETGSEKVILINYCYIHCDKNIVGLTLKKLSNLVAYFEFTEIEKMS